MGLAGKKKIFDGKYEILSIVGRGSRSVVYHTRNIAEGGTEIALKVLLDIKRDKLPNSEKLRREALAMVSSHHRYVVRLDDFHSVGELCYLSMEYAPEADLRKFTAKKGGRLPPAQAELFLTQAAEALEFVHKVGIIHRDIKPDNILVIGEKEIRLGDFGVALLPGDDSSPEELKMAVGTMDYMAPEVLEGVAYDQKSDIYSLGVSFYEMLSGKHPFSGASMADQLEVRKAERLVPLTTIAPEVPQYLSDVILQAMHNEPRKRFSSAKELLQNLALKKIQLETTPAKDAQSTQPVEDKSKSEGKAVIKEFPKKEEPRQQAPSVSTEQPAAKTAAPERQVSSEKSASQPKVEAPKREIKRTERPTELNLKPPVEVALKVSSHSPSEEDLADQESGKNQGVASMQSSYSGQTARVPQRQGLDARRGKESRSPTLFITKEITDQIRSDASIQGGQVGGQAAEPFDFVPEVPAPRRRVSPLLLIGALIVVGFFAYRGISVLPIGKSIGKVVHTTPTKSPSSIPVYAGAELTFPNLPSGMYVGYINGVIPGKASPLTLVSFGDRHEISVIVGVEGWTPTTVTVPTAGEGLGDSLRITSNGFILELVGEAGADSIQGAFTNAITGEAGEWGVKPATP